MEPHEIRRAVREHIHLLAHPSGQLKYEQNVPIAYVPGELVDMFCADLYHPKSPAFLAAFTEDELKDLARLYGLLVEASGSGVSSVTDLLKLPEWREVLNLAQHLDAQYQKESA